MYMYVQPSWSVRTTLLIHTYNPLGPFNVRTTLLIRTYNPLDPSGRGRVDHAEAGGLGVAQGTENTD